MGNGLALLTAGAALLAGGESRLAMVASVAQRLLTQTRLAVAPEYQTFTRSVVAGKSTDSVANWSYMVELIGS